MASIVGKGVMGEEVVSWVVEEALPEAWTLMVRRGQAAGRVSEVMAAGRGMHTECVGGESGSQCTYRSEFHVRHCTWVRAGMVCTAGD